MARIKYKRPQYILRMIDSINERLREAKVKDKQHPLVSWTIDYLTQNGCYQGWRYIKDMEVNGKIFPILGNWEKQKEYDYIMFY